MTVAGKVWSKKGAFPCLCWFRELRLLIVCPGKQFNELWDVKVSHSTCYGLTYSSNARSMVRTLAGTLAEFEIWMEVCRGNGESNQSSKRWRIMGLNVRRWPTDWKQWVQYSLHYLFPLNLWLLLVKRIHKTSNLCFLAHSISLLENIKQQP